MHRASPKDRGITPKTKIRKHPHNRMSFKSDRHKREIERARRCNPRKA